jgi:hypothetical protein
MNDDVDPTAHNPEVGLPVHPDNAWHVPEIMGRIWRAGEVQDALTAAGFTPLSFDITIAEGEGEAATPLMLRRSQRWVKDDAALRVPTARNRIVSPYLAACVSALLA